MLQNNVSEITVSCKLNPNAVSFETNNVNISENACFVRANYKDNFKAFKMPRRCMHTFLSTTVFKFKLRGEKN